MSVATVNNHVLFGQSADWRKPPEWTRLWQSEVASAVTGKQSRNSLRATARHSLSFQITPGSEIEQAILDDAIRAAKKLGLACAPFHGRGCRIDGTFTGDELICGRGWDWQAGDFVHVENGSGFEISEVSAAAYDGGAGLWTLTLDDVLTGEYTSYVRPLIFGKFDCGEMEAITPALGPVKLTIAELTNARTAQIGEVEAPSGAGIGIMSVGSTFQVA